MTAAATTTATTPAPLPLPNELILLAEAQWLFSESDLLHTPSVIAGLTPTQERENRAKGVNFILQVGIMLKLPQITLATASVFLHRFFMRHPMIEDRVAGRQHQHYYSIAATCLFLATKVEENCRKMKDLVVACVRVAQKEPNKEVDEQDKEFWRWRDVLLQLEDLLLEALCFDLSLESPYKLLYSFLVHFQEENNKPLRNTAWAFVNDSCLTPLCLLYPARTIAAAAIYAAARHCDVKLLDDERGRPWWNVAGSDLSSIRKACNYMASLYENVSTSSTNGDTGKNPIYQHTPESSGEERFAKTRAYRPGVSPQDSRQSSPLTGPLHHTQPLQSTRDRETSISGSERSRKRNRESGFDGEEGEIARSRSRDGGSGLEDEATASRSQSQSYSQSYKRQRTLSNGERHQSPAGRSTSQRLTNGTNHSVGTGVGTGTIIRSGQSAATQSSASATTNGFRSGSSRTSRNRSGSGRGRDMNDGADDSKTPPAAETHTAKNHTAEAVQAADVDGGKEAAAGDGQDIDEEGHGSEEGEL